MQAVLLAAGKSSRFYPYNKGLEHKSLVVMMGKTLVEHTIDNLQKIGIDNIIIVVGKNSPIPHILPERSGMKCTFVEQREPLGMGNAVLQAKDFLEDTFFVLGAYHMDAIDFVQDMQAMHNDDNVTVLVKKDEVLHRYGMVTLEKEKVIEIVEKPKKVTKDSLRLLSIYLLSKKFLIELEETPAEEYHFEKALSSFAKKGHVVALTTEKPTVTLKYAWDLLGIKDYLLGCLQSSTISPKASIAQDAVLLGNVIVADGANILEGVCIKGPAYIGKGVTLGNRAILRGGVIVEDNSVIGSQMEMKNTFVMENTTTHAGFIGDSVIGADTKIAGGFITANVRLDRQNITTIVNGEEVDTGLRHFGTIIGNNDNIGIRVSTMPGVVIGNNCLVGPSTTIMKNIDDNKKYYTKFQEVVEQTNAK